MLNDPLLRHAPTRIQYLGKASSFAALLLQNLIFTALTAGLYYPWAKTHLRKYIWQNVDVDGHRIEYVGTGREIFIGYVKIYGLYGALLYGVAWLGKDVSLQISHLAKGALSVAVAIVIPYLIFNAYRYLSARTRFRGLHFNLMNGRSEFISTTLLGTLLSAMTLGIYFPVMKNQQRRILFSNLRYGDLQFRFDGEDKEFLLLCLKGTFFSVVTFGIYFFQFRAEALNFIYSHVTVDEARFKLELTWQDVFTLMLAYVVVAVCTFGLGVPWYRMMALHRIVDRLEMIGRIDFGKVNPARDTASAGGDSAVDAFDIDIGAA